jgi:purine-binding chemotaxis protein CheW
VAQYCTFRVADLFFGVEVERVQEVLRMQRMTRVPLASKTVRGLINLRGEIVTAIDLRRRLELTPAPEDAELMNVVIRGEESAVSFLVDDIGDVLEVPDDTFEPPPVTLSGVTRRLVRSICKLHGELLLILDPVEATQIVHPQPRSAA